MIIKAPNVTINVIAMLIKLWKEENKFPGSKSGEKKNPIKGRNLGQILPSCIQRGEGMDRRRESPAAGVMKLHEASLSHDGSRSLTPVCD